MPHRRAWRRIKMALAPESVPIGIERRADQRRYDRNIHRLRNMWLLAITLIMLYTVISLQHQIGQSNKLRYDAIRQRCDQENILIGILRGFHSLNNPFSQKLVLNYSECRDLQHKAKAQL